MCGQHNLVQELKVAFSLNSLFSLINSRVVGGNCFGFCHVMHIGWMLFN